MKSYKRIYHGDLRQKYEDEVIHAPPEDDKGHIMAIKNIMCGHITIDCAFAAGHYWNWEISEDECYDQCHDQYWDTSLYDDWQSPCEGRDWEDDDDWDHGDHWDHDDHWENTWDMEDLFADEVLKLLLK